MISQSADRGQTGFLVAPLVRCLRFRGILGRTTLVELRNTYAGSVLGLSWLVVGQVFMLGIYALTYTVIFRVNPDKMTVADYVLYVFCGLVPYMTFAAAISAGAGVLTKDRQLLLNTVFPSELLPVRAALVSSAGLPIGVTILIVIALALGKWNATLLLVPFVMVLQFMFQCGLIWLLSLLTLVVRDVQFMIQYVMMMLLIATPIGYTVDMMPKALKVMAYANPLFYFVTWYQDLIVMNKLPSLPIVAVTIVMSVMVFALGFWIFERAKTTFFDYA
jgi:lipopolysaccharide transport system permease protein